MINAKSPHWKGGKINNGQGYVWFHSPGHPNRTNGKYVLEHRLVMEQIVGRYLRRDEIVHHLNGIKNDNRPENLVLVTKNNHDTFSFIHALQQRICKLEGP